MAVQILWSGLTGRTGREAMQCATKDPEVEIVAGVSRFCGGGSDVTVEVKTPDADGLTTAEIFDFPNVKWYRPQDLSKMSKHDIDCDIVIDFSHPDCFNEVLNLAIRKEVPLISETSGLSNRQMATLYDATHRIPVFRGGNFRFKVKQFIDDAVEFAKRNKGSFDLYENFWQGKDLPSETSKVLQRRIFEATKREVIVHSSATFAPGNWINDWELQVHRRLSPTGMFQDKISCRVIGFDELAHDVLEIAKVMVTKPIKKLDFYDLDEIWDDLPH